MRCAAVLLTSVLLPAAGLVARAPAFRPAPPRAVSPLARRVVMQEDASGAYRTLGISEDSSYDEVMDAYMALSETYSSDTARLGALEAAKEKVLDDRLRQRMAGTLKPAVADSPWDEKPVERIPPWVIAGEFAGKLFEIPTPKFALQVISLLGGLTLASWISPNSAGTILLINVMSAMGFMYNRGQPEVRRDDYGQIGEIRPMKPKPMALTCGVTFVLWMWGYLRTKRMVALMIIPKQVELIVRGTLISAALSVAALFLKPHGVFE